MNIEFNSEIRPFQWEQSIGNALVLETSNGNEFLSMVVPLTQDSIQGLTISHRRIESAIEEFRRAATAANDRFALQARYLITDLTNGQIVCEDRVRNLHFLLSLTRQIEQRYSETVDHLMDLEELNHEGKLGEYGDAIYAMYAVRIKTLELVSAKMEIIREQENHELNFIIALHNQKLKEQTQKMDEAFQYAFFSLQEKKREQKRKLDERAQQLKEEKDLLQLAAKELEIKEKIKDLNRKHHEEVEQVRRAME